MERTQYFEEKKEKFLDSFLMINLFKLDRTGGGLSINGNCTDIMW